MKDSGRERRRFTIGDGMVLIAATAPGLAVFPTAWESVPDSTLGRGVVLDWVVRLLITSLPLLLSWTLSVAALRSRHPRPSWRRISRQPGMIATLAASLATSTFLPVLAMWWFRKFLDGDGMKSLLDLPGELITLLPFLAPVVGVGVSIAWALLAIQGRWRSEPTWIDRAGRVLGVAWIGSGLIIGAVVVIAFVG